MRIHGPDPVANRKRVEAVKKAVGDGVRLMVDVNQELDVDAAIRQARALEDFDLVWYEEPTLADDPAGCAEVARAIRIPVATGENNYTRFEFRELIERGAARYLMPDVCRANGFTETLRIGALAAAHQVALSPHVVHELSVHVAAALPNRSEEHTSELQSRLHLVCRLLLEKKISAERHRLMENFSTNVNLIT